VIRGGSFNNNASNVALLEPQQQHARPSQQQHRAALRQDGGIPGPARNRGLDDVFLFHDFFDFDEERFIDLAYCEIRRAESSTWLPGQERFLIRSQYCQFFLLETEEP